MFVFYSAWFLTDLGLERSPTSTSDLQVFRQGKKWRSRLTKSEWITGKTLGKTMEASARYSYRIRTSDSLVVYLTRVAITVRTRTCVT